MAIPQAKANEDRPHRGITLMLVAFFIFSMIDTNAKWLAALSIPALQLSFMRYFGHFVISTALLARGGPSSFGTTQLPLVLARSFLLTISTVMNFIAVQYLPLTLTATILFSAPIMVCALSRPLLGEQVGPWRWSAILAGFCGILIVIRPLGENFHWAMALSLIGAFLFALYFILTRKLSGIVASDTMQFYSGFIGTASLLPFAIATWQNPESAIEWGQLVSLGILGWLGHELVTRAHGFAPSSTLSPFSYSFIFYMSLWSFIIFGQTPDRWTLVGAGILILSGLVIWFRESKIIPARQKA